jgi:hypothetical protein
VRLHRDLNNRGKQHVREYLGRDPPLPAGAASAACLGIPKA